MFYFDNVFYDKNFQILDINKIKNSKETYILAVPSKISVKKLLPIVTDVKSDFTILIEYLISPRKGISALNLIGLLKEGSNRETYFKFLRGTKLDIFGYTLERKKERALAQKTITTINKISEILNDNNYKKIIEFLDIPLSIKGYGHVKEKNIKIAEQKWDKSFDKILNNQNFKKVS